jgi:rSAM/selenodomain-associated transferase 1
MNNPDALIILAKAPLAGLAKTRLRGYLSDSERLMLYTAMLEDTIDVLKCISGVDTFVAYAPDDSGEYFSAFGTGMFVQSGGDIGQRMHSALGRVLSEGYQKAVVVGVDIPGLRPEVVLRALELLSESDLVFGPSEDGGYYLVGCKRPVREIFEGIEWSTRLTLAQSLEKAAHLGLTTAFTGTLMDIDTPEDLKRYLATE